MVWQQALDFRPDGSERAVLDLDQLVVGDHVDPVVVQRRFDASAAIGIELLELSVQRRFTARRRPGFGQRWELNGISGTSSYRRV